MPITKEELDDELCEYCPYTEYGNAKVNTGYWNLCEGCSCDEAYKNYLENHEGGRVMGLDISIKGMSYDETYHCGYITFGNYRRAVAKAYNEEFGLIYEKQYKDLFMEKYSDEDTKRWNELCNDDLDLFLNHSDCDGKLTWQDCKKIWSIMKDLDVKIDGHNYGTMKAYDMHQLWLNMFKFCATKRVNMYFG